MPIYSFHCTWCETTTDKIFKSDERPNLIKCPNCNDYPAEYRVGKPAHFRIAIDGNGRKGYKTDQGNGKKTVRSATREQYEHRAGNMSAKDFKANPRSASQSVYTKEYGKKVEAEKKEKMKTLEKAITAIKENK
jgi:putative FmdB family regulatory protein